MAQLLAMLQVLAGTEVPSYTLEVTVGKLTGFRFNRTILFSPSACHTSLCTVMEPTLVLLLVHRFLSPLETIRVTMVNWTTI